MLKRIEERNREIWSDHSTMLEDVTHVISGIGIGLLLAPLVEQRKAKPIGWAMVLLSTAIHFYADTIKPSASLKRGRRKRRGPVESLRDRFSS